MPWPRRLGTPPWGAQRELEYGAARIGTLYTLDVLRGGAEDDLVTAFDTLVDVVDEGEPALLYVGNALAPRHVVLVLPGDGDRMLDVYDPATGRVDHLRRDTVVQRRLGLSGWDVPWVAVRPTGLRTVRSRATPPTSAPPRPDPHPDLPAPDRQSCDGVRRWAWPPARARRRGRRPRRPPRARGCR